ncbi:fibrobacter succinogenes major paralogous domain-containing protein [bacterium]|nr:fibrobacter succinogenes major paralogous domain-containing protein [bacterium]
MNKSILLSLLVFIAAAGLTCDENEPTGTENRSETVTDIDGNTYRTVKIGNQIWMAENLKVTHYRNGDPIPLITGDEPWSALSTGARCCYDNDTGHIGTYGLLYNRFALTDTRNIAPEGWHAPTDEDWKELEMVLGMSRSEACETGWRGTNEGGQLKENGTGHWENPNTGATNESGFTALPAGFRNGFGDFVQLGEAAYFWSTAGYRNIAYYGYACSAICRETGMNQCGCSVRLIRNR